MRGLSLWVLSTESGPLSAYKMKSLLCFSHKKDLLALIIVSMRTLQITLSILYSKTLSTQNHLGNWGISIGDCFHTVLLEDFQGLNLDNGVIANKAIRGATKEPELGVDPQP